MIGTKDILFQRERHVFQMCGKLLMFSSKKRIDADSTQSRSMNRDRDIYGPDADQFRPERFLQQSEKGAAFVLRQEYEVDDGHCAYGFGRR